MAYGLVYVDNIILTSSSSSTIAEFAGALRPTFDIRDLGPLLYFLGVSVRRSLESKSKQWKPIVEVQVSSPKSSPKK